MVFGLYLMIQGTKLLIPSKNPKYDIVESYSGNIWRPHDWKRAKMLLASLYLIPVMVYLMRFSMSATFGENIWYCIVTYKVLQAINEYFLVKLCDDQLLMGPNSIACDLMGGIFTMGADDFLTYLKGAFVDLCVLMIDRAYFGVFMNFATDKVEGFFEYLKDYFVKQFFRSTASSSEEVNGSPRGSPRSPDGGEEEEESDDSSKISNDPVFIEESSIENAEEKAEEVKEELQMSYSESMAEENGDQSPHMEAKQEEEGKVEEKKEDEEKKEGDQEEEEEGSREDPAEPPLDMYGGFARNNVSQWLNVYIMAIIYLFYKETQIGSGYGIRVEDFTYYIIFIVCYLPFQTVNEILFLNISEYFLKCPIHDYTDFLHLRYANRQTRWKGHDRDINPSLNEEFQTLDQWGFSSQYYFTYTLYVVGMLLCIFAVQIWSTGPYNPFGDLGTFIIAPLTMICCLLVHKISMLVGDLLGIWKVKGDIEAEQKARENAVSIYEIFNAVQDPNKEKGEEEKAEYGFTKDQWRKVEIEQKRMDWIKPDLQTDRMIAQTYREMFLELNKPLPVETAYHYLTHSVRQNNREEIVAQFAELYGILKPDNLAQEESDDESPARKASSILPVEEVNLSGTASKMVQRWLQRARLRRRLRFQVGKIVEAKKDKVCEKCSGSAWLKAECDDEILKLFDEFVKEEGGDENNYNVLTWRRYFRRHAAVHTTCIECRVPELSEKSEDIMRQWLETAKTRLHQKAAP